MMGVTPQQAVTGLSDAGADVVGVNCGNGIDLMVELAHDLRKMTEGFLLVHSNAGIPVITKGIIRYTETPDYMAKRFKILSELGINIIGGCCGTTPAHIQALVNAIKH